ncbi:12497_t:CDS:2 [Ambispora gerdemannii]|uniref:12497_t:CDS:1 n=1 Tax=Ambispora gerdemannii TaxID=144530 RepID=A0A9N8V3U9_9GLOM|nr:12497_t:CDS:2 [Ambispora gerdemannii]
MSSTTTARDIPAIKKAEPGVPHPTHFSTTPAGTIYSSTPGGSRIVYDRSTLLNLANSPLAKTPPSNLAFIPGVTKPNPHHTAHDNSSATTQFQGHLAPPQPALPSLHQQSNESETNSNNHQTKPLTGAAEDGHSHEQPKDHDHDMFHMDME